MSNGGNQRFKSLIMPLGLYTAQLNFETLRDIGQQGRNSEVFLAHDKQLDGEIVVKQISKLRLTNAAEFYRETKILHASSHPNVVKVNYGCEDADSVFIAMPYYKNGSLKTLMTSRHLTIREVIRYSVQFLSGLNNIHSKGLIHFDIKPDNILLSDSNEALLSDFGLAKAMDNLGFAAPDQIYGKQVPPEGFANVPKTLHFDIYLAGLTIYRMINGDTNYYSQFNFTSQPDYMRAVTSGTFPNRTTYLPHIPLKLQRIINKAISVNIADRHQSVLELINELGEIDENLDWIYTSTGTVEQWKRVESDREYNITLDKSVSTNITLNSTKTMTATTRTTRVTDHCKNNLTSTNVLSSIKKALKEV